MTDQPEHERPRRPLPAWLLEGRDPQPEVVEAFDLAAAQTLIDVLDRIEAAIHADPERTTRMQAHEAEMRASLEDHDHG